MSSRGATTTMTTPSLGKGIRRFMQKNGLNKDEHISQKSGHVVVFMQGLPGSGKTTMAKRWIELNAMVYQLSPKKHFIILSADDFFEKNTTDGLFDGKRLNEAHAHCRQQFEKIINNDTNEEEEEDYSEMLFIVVDNCNLEAKYVSLYVDMINSKNEQRRQQDEEPLWTWCLLSPNTDWKNNPAICATKSTHGVPLKTIEKMKSKQTLYDECDIHTNPK